jgi:hypothetical protein
MLPQENIVSYSLDYLQCSIESADIEGKQLEDNHLLLPKDDSSPILLQALLAVSSHLLPQ